MKRSQLKNKTNKTGLKEDLKLYKIQRNVVTKLNWSLKKVISKKNFRKEKPYFTNRGICNDEPIILVGNDKVLRINCRNL